LPPQQGDIALCLAYILVLVFTALLIAAFTWLVEKSGNNVQDAIQADANARIATAGTEAAQANAKAKQLGSDLTTEKGKVADLQIQAANAKAMQQKVEIELAKQQERAANAEQALLQPQRRTAPRRISADQSARLVAALSSGPKGPVEVNCSWQDSEACAFAQQILGVLLASGWSAKGVNQLALMPNPNAPPPFNGPPTGLWVEVRSASPPPEQATALQKAFFAEGIVIQGTVVPNIAADSVMILVAPKPQM
jgi:hypothetical protein